MNPIDKVAAKARRDYERRVKPRWRLFGDDEKEVRAAVHAYRDTVPVEQYELELLASDFWGRCNITEASYALRNVVLRLAGATN